MNLESTLPKATSICLWHNPVLQNKLCACVVRLFRVGERLYRCLAVPVRPFDGCKACFGQHQLPILLKPEILLLDIALLLTARNQMCVFETFSGCMIRQCRLWATEACYAGGICPAPESAGLARNFQGREAVRSTPCQAEGGIIKGE